MAIVLGSLPLLLGVGLGVWSIRALAGRERVYVTMRASLYIILGFGLVVGHWSPSVGLASVVLFITGLVAVGLGRTRILAPSNGGAGGRER